MPHNRYTKAEEAELSNFEWLKKVSLGPHALLASHCIAITHHLLDTSGLAGEGKLLPWGCR